ncbi:hypothetical protein EJ06DRAFT_52637 [Trichodelitschia bisporula]|uniref:Uncharacterized protein n=1 Tax=Trichodelitschia bisporula TaxID=703511 RepID=A0A6G1HTR3_9PEZI|nr:hypothetical protein EJ06DRAFT_52637 [Trichodelitschia bisporula]
MKGTRCAQAVPPRRRLPRSLAEGEVRRFATIQRRRRKLGSKGRNNKRREDGRGRVACCWNKGHPVPGAEVFSLTMRLAALDVASVGWRTIGAHATPSTDSAICLQLVLLDFSDSEDGCARRERRGVEECDDVVSETCGGSSGRGRVRKGFVVFLGLGKGGAHAPVLEGDEAGRGDRTDGE